MPNRQPNPPFDRVAFDCDSTLSRIEGIDELGREHRAAVEALTQKAMSGALPLTEVYGKRLATIQPLRNEVATVGRLYIENAVPGARELIAALRSLGKEVLILSGGLRMPVVTFAQWLGLRDEHVHAVQVSFDGDGRYTTYDTKSPLVRNDGKREIMAGLPEGKRTAFVGDGITDAETRTAVDSFICFRGVARRPEVAEHADAVVDTPSLAGLLPVLFTAQELDRLGRDPRHRDLVRRASLEA